ncbi:hypothetical protein KR026_011037, partial [Drosophila bipectinata]
IIVREDYCELYCGGLCNNIFLNKTCNVSNNRITTSEYQIELEGSIIKLNWITKDFNQWNIQNISLKNNIKVDQLSVTGLPSADDLRFCPGVYYLENLAISEAERFELYSPSLKIKETKIRNLYGPEELSIELYSNIQMESTIINNYIKRTMNNITQLKIFSGYIHYKLTLQIGENVFEGKSKLKKLQFYSLKVKGLTAESFNDLPSLEDLVFDDVDFESFHFFRSEVLRDTLSYLRLAKINGMVNLEYFDPYTELKIIEFDRRSYIPFENLTAFICFEAKDFCNFTIGINYIPCPPMCQCLYYRSSNVFSINCSWNELLDVQPLPIPINGKTSLILQGNNLTQLPNRSLPGYSIVEELDASYNKLTSLEVSHLPNYLEYFDVRFNHLHTLSENVIHYLHKVPFFYQYGNKWNHSCKEMDLTFFFERKSNIIRIHESKFDPIFENMININSKFNIKKQFQKTNSYFFAKEDNIIKGFPGNEILMALEYLHKNISYYSAEYDPILYDSLNTSCPYRCSCCTNSNFGNFWIDCRKRNLNFYPELPYPIQNDATLFLMNNKIRTLPNPTFSKGHASMKYLLMANNSLMKLPLQLIPQNITYMDLRNNLLLSLDDDVVKFIWNRENITSVSLTGNPWECKCEAILFLYFLRKQDPVEYEKALQISNITREKCPESCVCCEDKSRSASFNIDCSGRGLRDIPPLPLPTTGQTTLIFDKNELEILPNISHPGFENVAYLSLANNKLTFIDQLPSKLIYLDLSQNNISVLNEDIRNFLIKRIRSSQLKLLLEGNPWSCSCEDKEFLKFVWGNAENIIDSAAMICGETGHSLIGLEVSDICPSALIYYATLTAFLMILILGINLLVIFRQPILIWFYEHEICLSLAVRRELDLEKKFDAFLSFTHKDEELVAEFVERLENGNHKFRLCFYLRDWLVGESIPECINRSVKDSRRIIILMTNNFMKSIWGRLEFRLALHATTKDRCKRLIVVLYPDVENFDDLDSELRAYMVLNTYLARDSPNFWNKLIYSMP